MKQSRHSQLVAEPEVLHVKRQRLLVVTRLQVGVAKHAAAVSDDALFARNALRHASDVTDETRGVHDDVAVVAIVHH